MAKQTFTTGQVLTAAQMTSLQQTAMGGGSTTAKTTSYVLVAADAGTVIQMNAAGATTITVNTALFAAGDTVQIQNIGAGVCTVTAGTATVTTAGSLALSQWEGGQLYFTSASASIFFDVVQGSGGGSASYTLLNAGGTALSGTTLTVSGISGMSSLLVIIDGGSATTAGQSFRLRLNTDTTVANYEFWNYSINNPAAYATSILTGAENAGDAYFPLVNMANNAASLVYAGAEIKGANSTAIKTIDSIGGATPGGSNTMTCFSQKGIYLGTSTISSISIFCSGTMDAGTVYVYGSAV
jgi:hypothetical protein